MWSSLPKDKCTVYILGLFQETEEICSCVKRQLMWGAGMRGYHHLFVWDEFLQGLEPCVHLDVTFSITYPPPWPSHASRTHGSALLDERLDRVLWSDECTLSDPREVKLLFKGDANRISTLL